jgi:tRNA(fMet)-specific endonuclease VapC
MRYLLDTSFVIDAVLRSPVPFRRAFPHLSARSLALSVISLAELYEGPFHSTNPTAASRALHAHIAPLTVIPLDESICERFGRLRAQIRKNGRNVSDLDLLIGATAIDRDMTLLTRDLGDFQKVPDLRIAKL